MFTANPQQPLLKSRMSQEQDEGAVRRPETAGPAQSVTIRACLDRPGYHFIVGDHVIVEGYRRAVELAEEPSNAHLEPGPWQLAETLRRRAHRGER